MASFISKKYRELQVYVYRLEALFKKVVALNKETINLQNSIRIQESRIDKLIQEKIREAHADISEREAIFKKTMDSKETLLNKRETTLLKTIRDKETLLNKREMTLLKTIQDKETLLNKKEVAMQNTLNNKEQAIKQIIKEKSIGFPWLADVIAEYNLHQDNIFAKYLAQKKQPALSAAEKVRQIAKEKATLTKQLLVARNFVHYYEALFPWLTDFVGENLDDMIRDVTLPKVDETEDDPVLNYITKAEYSNLTETVRNQRALDRYMQSSKTPSQIGKAFERYIGYKYNQQGYKVVYTGIEMGLEDLGRDLICRKGDEVKIVQCKYWSSQKTIHEKHINQLFGTTVKYYLDQTDKIDKQEQLDLLSAPFLSKSIQAVLYTHTHLSETAMKFAHALRVEVHQNVELENYPIIKCNVSPWNEKIYHLPFDQQYDKTIICNSGEFYANTVQEAEQKGFRRAYRWRGSKAL